MKELWRRSTAVLRDHPIVWVPVLCADLLSFAAKTCSGALGSQLVLSVLRSQASVFSRPSGLIASHVTSVAQAASWVAFLNLTTQFVTLCLYAFAALATWSLVHTVVDQPKPAFAAAIHRAESKRWRIFDLVLRTFGVVLCCSILPAVLLGLAMPFLPLARQDRMSFLHAGQFVTLLLGYIAAACWVAPRALRLMQAEPGTPIGPRTLGDARLVAAIAVAISLAISSICQMAVRSYPALRFRDHFWASVVTGASVSLLSALPFVVLFVFLSLAADDEPEGAQGNDTLVIDDSAGAAEEAGYR